MSRKRKYLRKYEEGGSKPEIKLPLKGDGGGPKVAGPQPGQKGDKTVSFLQKQGEKKQKKALKGFDPNKDLKSNAADMSKGQVKGKIKGEVVKRGLSAADKSKYISPRMAKNLRMGARLGRTGPLGVMGGVGYAMFDNYDEAHEQAFGPGLRDIEKTHGKETRDKVEQTTHTFGSPGGKGPGIGYGAKMEKGGIAKKNKRKYLAKYKDGGSVGVDKPESQGFDWGGYWRGEQGWIPDYGGKATKDTTAYKMGASAAQLNAQMSLPGMVKENVGYIQDYRKTGEGDRVFNDFLDNQQKKLTVLGNVVGPGDIADLTNAGISKTRAYFEDDPVKKAQYNVDAATSTTAAIPFMGAPVGVAATGDMLAGNPIRDTIAQNVVNQQKTGPKEGPPPDPLYAENLGPKPVEKAIEAKEEKPKKQKPKKEKPKKESPKEKPKMKKKEGPAPKIEKPPKAECGAVVKFKKKTKRKSRKYFLGGLVGGAAGAAAGLFGKRKKGSDDAEGAEGEGEGGDDRGFLSSGMMLGGLGGLFGHMYKKLDKDKQKRINEIMKEK